jgi:hypothetical protein
MSDLQKCRTSSKISTMAKQLVRLAVLGVALVVGVGVLATVAYADSLQSAHYQLDESTVGSGGLIQSTSSNLQSVESLGDAAIGNSSSTNFQVESGSQTTADPVLGFSVNNGSASFGIFSPSTAATTSSTFSVSDYTSYGYAVQLVGTPPTNGAHTITPMATTDVSRTGVEQFGINLVANTLPASVGANPDHGLFGVGDASPNYATSNNYRYVSGETIASAPKSSGVTTYTISYIVNVTPLTPGGQYTSNQAIVCTGTY